jgi:hypothetical protein
MGESIMNTTQYFDSIQEQLERVNDKLKDINTTIDKLMDGMVEMGWMERKEETDEIDETNKSSNQSTTYDGEIVVKYKHENNNNDESYMYDINRSI